MTSCRVTTRTDETNRAGPEHVPDPGIAELDTDPAAIEVLDLHLVREVETALCLDHEREHREHVAVLAVELELPLLLEALDVVLVHGVMLSCEVASQVGRPTDRSIPGSSG